MASEPNREQELLLELLLTATHLPDDLLTMFLTLDPLDRNWISYASKLIFRPELDPALITRLEGFLNMSHWGRGHVITARALARIRGGADPFLEARALLVTLNRDTIDSLGSVRIALQSPTSGARVLCDALITVGDAADMIDILSLVHHVQDRAPLLLRTLTRLDELVADLPRGAQATWATKSHSSFDRLVGMDATASLQLCTHLHSTVLLALWWAETDWRELRTPDPQAATAVLVARVLEPLLTGKLVGAAVYRGITRALGSTFADDLTADQCTQILHLAGSVPLKGKPAAQFLAATRTIVARRRSDLRTGYPGPTGTTRAALSYQGETAVADWILDMLATAGPDRLQTLLRMNDTLGPHPVLTDLVATVCALSAPAPDRTPA
jgi:hypothetical protein